MQDQPPTTLLEFMDSNDPSTGLIVRRCDNEIQITASVDGSAMIFHIDPDDAVHLGMSLLAAHPNCWNVMTGADGQPIALRAHVPPPWQEWPIAPPSAATPT